MRQPWTKTAGGRTVILLLVLAGLAGLVYAADAIDLMGLLLTMHPRPPH